MHCELPQIEHRRRPCLPIAHSLIRPLARARLPHRGRAAHVVAAGGAEPVYVAGPAEVLDVITVGLFPGARAHRTARDLIDQGGAGDVLAAHGAHGMDVAVRGQVYLVRLLLATVPAMGAHRLFHFLPPKIEGPYVFGCSKNSSRNIP
jgi:hypothetical protein